jgi:hypothetical protein
VKGGQLPFLPKARALEPSRSERRLPSRSPSKTQVLGQPEVLPLLLMVPDTQN